ncbi:putative beta-N-acetylhexosaminidase [Streptantibioticus cattleyicolor NRRL 8057 = DSM 46488]|nr:putative beta-N-acetylhexosaminidase [Streptantibioticus cattleyicolor NRRL 8057 = DSM 46488]
MAGSRSSRASGAGGCRTVRTGRRAGAVGVVLAVAVAVAGCGGGGGGRTAARTAAGSPVPPPMAPSVTRAAPSVTPTVRPSANSPATPAPTGAPSAPDCVGRVLAGMSDVQRVGQVFMVSAPTTGGGQAPLRAHAVGSVMLMGHSTAGVARVREVTRALDALAVTAGGVRVPPLVATDQEGGTVQVLGGPGFTTIPSAVRQGRLAPERLQELAAGWGRQLRSAGVTVDLAPVADTVPPGLGAANAPIGRLSREYGDDPAAVAAHSTAFLRGLDQAGVLATAKHFPGLGRVTGNTDFTADVTDATTTRDDAFLAPFRRAVRAGVPLVMISSARYPRIDAAHLAAFSPVVIGDMLRGDLGFDGVVVSDDLGHAAAVRAVPPGDRAVDFLGAGGDLVLTADPASLPAMTAAVLARLPSDAGLRAAVGRGARHVLVAKERAGLLRCG